jgi:hypothetical protein
MNRSLCFSEMRQEFAVGLTDLFMAVYLPFCDVFATRDAEQESCLRELTKHIGVNPEIPGPDGFEGEL